MCPGSWSLLKDAGLSGFKAASSLLWSPAGFLKHLCRWTISYIIDGMLFYEAKFCSLESKHIILYFLEKNYGSVAGVRKLNPKVPTGLLCLLAKTAFPWWHPIILVQSSASLLPFPSTLWQASIKLHFFCFLNHVLSLDDGVWWVCEPSDIEGSQVLEGMCIFLKSIVSVKITWF